MKKIVIYQSGTGFTAKYAAWIAEELSCEAKELKQTDIKTLAEYDMVIYGGWLMAGMISGYDKIRALHLKNVIVFGVGMSPESEKIVTTIAEQNQVQKEKCFYFRGGYSPEKLNFFKRMLIKMIKKNIQKKVGKTEEDMQMLKIFDGGDFTKKEAIGDLIQMVKMY